MTIGETIVAAAVLMLATNAHGQGVNKNLFALHEGSWYVNPSYRTQLQSSIETSDGNVRETLESMLNITSAYWIDVKGKLTGNTTSTLEGILADSASKASPELVVLIVYDLPNRDCHAKASNGEICCTYLSDGRCDYLANGDCAAGLEEYRNDYIDPFAAIVGKYAKQVSVWFATRIRIAKHSKNPFCRRPSSESCWGFARMN